MFVLLAGFFLAAWAVQPYLATVIIGNSSIRHIAMLVALHNDVANGNFHRTSLERLKNNGGFVLI